MKRRLVIAAALLAVFTASAAAATTVGWNVTTSADVTTYAYTLTSSEYGDFITSFHIYAPVAPEAVTAGSAPSGWAFGTAPDPETGGADIYWAVGDPLTGGLESGEELQVSMQVPASLDRIDDFIVPGCLGNWGYETRNYMDWGVLVSVPSVPVPAGAPSEVPEPAGLVTACVGCVSLVLRRIARERA